MMNLEKNTQTICYKNWIQTVHGGKIKFPTKEFTNNNKDMTNSANFIFVSY